MSQPTTSRSSGSVLRSGRTFTASEDSPNGPKAALISDKLWRSHFGADPTSCERRISLNGDSYPIVGVLPADSRPILQPTSGFPCRPTPAAPIRVIT